MKNIILVFLLLPLLCVTACTAQVSFPPNLKITASASSSESPEYSAQKAVDGNRRTRWSSAFTDNEWISFTFDSPTALYGLELLWERAYPEHYSIKVSSDNVLWSDVYTTDSGHAGPQDIVFPAITAQYVKIVITKRGTEWGNSLIEAIFKTVKNQPSMLDRMWNVQWRYDGILFDTSQWLCVTSQPGASQVNHPPSLSLISNIPSSAPAGYVLYISRKQFSHGKFSLQFEEQDLALEWMPDSIQIFSHGKVTATRIQNIPNPPSHLAVLLKSGSSPDIHCTFAVPFPVDRKDSFSVIRDNDIFWFEHNGRKFFERGVNCVLPYDGSKGKKYDVRMKFNNNMLSWASAQWTVLEMLNFNTVGCWSHNAAYQLNVPHSRVAGLAGNGKNRLVDVFSETYAATLFFEAWNQVYPFAGERGLIGWFANNELPWYGEYGWPTQSDQTLFDKYFALPAETPGKKRLVAFLERYYSDDQSLLKDDWEEHPASFKALLDMPKLSPVSYNAKKAKIEWPGVVAERYFSLSRAALRKYDPGTLFLGVRFAGGAPRSVLEACGRYVDVCSFNYYRKDAVIDTAYLDNIYALVKKPIMITEFSFRAMENNSGDKNSRGADVTVQTQQQRADGFSRYCSSMAQLPYIIGWDWFQYFDQPPGGRFDGENSNYGILSIHDTIYTNLAFAMKKTNADAERLHAQTSKTLPLAFNSDAWGELKMISVRKAPASVVFTGKDWLRLPALPHLFEVWSDVQDTWLRFDSASKVLKLSYNSGAGYGCGLNIRAGAKKQSELAFSDVCGAANLVIDVQAPKGSTFSVIINESGAMSPGEQYYVGKNGADGESFASPLQTGTGKMISYTIPLDKFEPQLFWGNQRGNATIDTQALQEISIGIQGKQGKGDLLVSRIRFEP